MLNKHKSDDPSITSTPLRFAMEDGVVSQVCPDDRKHYIIPRLKNLFAVTESIYFYLYMKILKLFTPIS